MKNNLKKIHITVIILITFFLTSCERDLYENLEYQSLKEVSLKDFESKTGLYNFKENFKSSLLDSSLQARLPDGSYELSDFNINTDVIKELIISEKVTYSFVIEPTIRTSKSIFNLIVFNKDGNWYMNILELIPTEQNYQQLINNQTTKFEGSIRKIYDNSVSETNTEGSRFSISFHCTRTGSCESGVCDLCDYCITVYSTPTFDFTIAPPNSPGDTTISNSGGGSSGYIFSPNLPTLGDYFVLTENIDNFWASLTDGQQDWANLNTSKYNRLLEYLDEQNFSHMSQIFAKDLIDLANQEENQADVVDLMNISILVESSEDRFFTDEFELSLDPYVDLNLGVPTSTYSPGYLTMNFFLNYSRLRGLNPEWPRAKCAWEASKGIIHLSLDIFGTIPVFGEPADLVNGVLYVIEGDGINATLSFAGSVPVLGWAATGTKFGLKIVNVANDINTTVKLVWKVLPNNVIYFGSVGHCRATLRKILGLAVGDQRIAHHIIPLNKQTKDIVQKASKSGGAFHMNEALNGIPLSSAVHNGSHFNYDNVIQDKFDLFTNDHPNPTPDQCYTFLTSLIQQVRDWIAAHPNTPINNIVLP